MIWFRSCHQTWWKCFSWIIWNYWRNVRIFLFLKWAGALLIWFHRGQSCNWSSHQFLELHSWGFSVGFIPVSQVLPVAQQQKKEPPLEEILRHLFAQETETVGRKLRVVYRARRDHSINTQNWRAAKHRTQIKCLHKGTRHTPGITQNL